MLDELNSESAKEMLTRQDSDEISNPTQTKRKKSVTSFSKPSESGTTSPSEDLYDSANLKETVKVGGKRKNKEKRKF